MAMREAVVFLAVSTCACGAASGTGRGVVAPHGELVELTWRADSQNDGELTAHVHGHGTFSGRYQQATTRVEGIAQMRDPVNDPGFNARIANHPDWEPLPQAWAKTVASDTATGLLRSESDERMSCTFALVDPSLGMEGGASGSCQLSSGLLVSNVTLTESERP